MFVSSYLVGFIIAPFRVRQILTQVLLSNDGVIS